MRPTFRPQLQSLVHKLGCPHVPDRKDFAGDPFPAYSERTEPLPVEQLRRDLETFQRLFLPTAEPKEQSRWEKLMRRSHWADRKMELHEVSREAMGYFWPELEWRLNHKRTELLRCASTVRLSAAALEMETLRVVDQGQAAFLEAVPSKLMKQYQAIIRATEVPERRDLWFPRADDHLYVGMCVAVMSNFEFIRLCPELVLDQLRAPDVELPSMPVRDAAELFEQPFTTQGLQHLQYLATSHLAVMMPVARRLRPHRAQPASMTILPEAGKWHLALTAESARKLANMRERVNTQTSLRNPTPRMRCPAVLYQDGALANPVAMMRSYTWELSRAHVFPEAAHLLTPPLRAAQRREPIRDVWAG